MKFSKRNITALKKLIEKYRSITLEQIKYAWDTECANDTANKVAKSLTGYGEFNSCSICKTVGVKTMADDCGLCFWALISDRIWAPCAHSKTYQNIDYAQTPKQLLTAFRKRADYIEKQLKKHNL